jgi:hypothetical protein
VPTPRPARERLVQGRSVVARVITTAPGVAALDVNGEVDWTTDSFLVVRDGVAVCTEAPP